MFRTGVLVLVLGVLPFAPQPESSSARFRSVEADLTSDSGEVLPLDEAGTQASLLKLWDVLGTAAVDALEANPRLSAEDLVQVLTGLEQNRHGLRFPQGGQPLTVTAVAVGSEPETAFAVAANWAGASEVFVVARQGGRFQVAASFQQLAQTLGEESQDPAEVLISKWKYRRPGLQQGPLSGTVHALPAGPEGFGRFYVIGDSLILAGTERRNQISVWEWQNGILQNLFIQGYWAASPRGTQAATLEGDVLNVRIQQRFKTMFTCVDCESPEALWSLEIGADQVQDRGLKPLVPELNQIDELLLGLQMGKDVSALAEATAREALQPVVAESAHEFEESGVVSQIYGWRVETCGGLKQVTLQTEDLPLSVFTFREGQPSVQSWTQGAADPVACAPEVALDPTQN